ncbi:ProQ/FinO family protein [Roseateles terrae]|uniref:ProQ/FinO domain-containing protein n=1 Tax=Roseateles terrae TaxID=431060 RepID=A0ABR6GR06_9BURK|nr:ProQ/FinO family protein [Roseateles terrae]MBB3194546.1 hypothetical protein [Roseateles terrae]
MSSSTQPTSAHPGDAASSTPETAPESLTTSAPAQAPDAVVAAPDAAPVTAGATGGDTGAQASTGEATAWADTVASDSDAHADAGADADGAEAAGEDAAADGDTSAQAGDQASAGKAGPKNGQNGNPSGNQNGGRVDVPAVAAALKELFPALFSGPARPVKLRIQADIQERAPGKFSKQQLSAFLRRYTGGTGYLIGLTKAKQRFDLDGQPAGEISDEHRQAAQEELTRRRGITETRRADEERGRQERAQLLRDFSRTTLTPANFCALKGLSQEQLDAQLALAREEASQQPQRDDRPPRGGDRRPQGPGRQDGGRGGERRAEGGQRPPRGDGAGRPRGDGPGRPRGDGQPRPDGGKRPPRRNNG